MRRRVARRILAGIWLVALPTASTASADVLLVEVDERSVVADGRAYGLAGPYERITGTVRFAVDPGNPANRMIVDIDLAPRNADRMVEFHSNFFILKPVDIARGNGTVLYEVSNRGGKGMLSYYNNAVRSRDPRTAEDMGDGFLLEGGFTLLWLGWQFDVPHRDHQMRVNPPIATNNGSPITGLVRSEVIVRELAHDWSLADRNHVPSGISILPAPDGTFIHPRAADPTKLSSSHNRPAPEAVTSAPADVQPTGAPYFQGIPQTPLHTCGLSSPGGLRSTRRASASRHWQRPDPP